MKQSIIDKEIQHLAIPSIISNITVPLLGLIDTTIVGHLGSPIYIGGIALGGMLFNILFWLFGFLRMGTSGITSQAYGEKNIEKCTNTLFRALLIASSFALILLLLKQPVLTLALHIIGASSQVETTAAIYFNICIWGAPATLGLYCYAGWFLGMQNSKFPMVIAIAQNVVNIILSLTFVYIFHLKIEGVAYGTLFAQYFGLFLAIFISLRKFSKYQKINFSIFNKKEFTHLFKVNRDIFFRTLCLIAVTTFFTSNGALQGDIILALNALMMQFFFIFSYFMDGLAYAAEALIGKYIGEKNERKFSLTLTHLFRWGISISILFTAIYILGAPSFFHILTNEKSVLTISDEYLFWVYLIPLLSFSAFIYDGIFIGSTATREMLISMAVATTIFFCCYYFLFQQFGNHALWFAFISYLGSRGFLQFFLMKKIRIHYFTTELYPTNNRS